MELFWQTIADYNTMTWPVQALIVLAAVVLTARLYLRPTHRVKTAMKCFLAFLNAWIAVAYYLVSCDARAYSGVMAFFWGVMAACGFMTRSSVTRRSNGRTNTTNSLLRST